MSVDLALLSGDDADEMVCRWGIKVAADMLHEGRLSRRAFLSLCEEVADATGRETFSPTSQRRSRSTDPRERSTGQVGSQRSDEILRLIDETLETTGAGVPLGCELVGRAPVGRPGRRTVAGKGDSRDVAPPRA